MKMSKVRHAQAAMLGAAFAALFDRASESAARAQPVAGRCRRHRRCRHRANGPEAGVWVIAETKDLPTKFFKVVADR